MFNIKKTIKKYKNFDKTFIESFIGIPSGYGGLKKPFYGTYSQFIKKYPNFKTNKKIPTVLFMHGSGKFVGGETYRQWIVEDCNFAFISPNSHAIKNRPKYKSPSSKKIYNEVHKIRQAELKYNTKMLLDLKWTSKKNMFLIGSSEGALAVGIYKGDEYKARVILAWSCEDGYYSSDTSIGAKTTKPILAIIGSHDEYFSTNSKFVDDKDENISGHCLEALLEYKNSKVVILPKTKHKLLDNIYTQSEIVNFLMFWNNKDCFDNNSY
ncbi:MAG: hypothetical protein U9R37_01475 [Campylobacterota bacterium]|nr:hypothetical protein [Campylobacterota bacterium]